MIGHECFLSQTNSYGWVPLCECGWIGTMTQPARPLPGHSIRGSRVRELTQSIARTQHGAHLEEVREQIAALTDRALHDHGRRIDLANEVLLRRGRWGNA